MNNYRENRKYVNYHQPIIIKCDQAIQQLKLVTNFPTQDTRKKKM
jgi:hypothetical protein